MLNRARMAWMRRRTTTSTKRSACAMLMSLSVSGCALVYEYDWNEGWRLGHVTAIGPGDALTLQEAGVVPADPVAFVRLPLLGIFPTVQTLAAQAGVLAVMLAVFLWGRRGGWRHDASPTSGA